LYKLSNLVYA